MPALNSHDLVREPIVEEVATDSALSAPVDRLLRELSAPTLGSRAMIRALLLECMIQLLRKRLQARDPALSWMAALIDERLWSALRLMLDRPGYHHTVESLHEDLRGYDQDVAAQLSRRGEKQVTDWTAVGDAG